jgi:hypothetical protein
VPVGIYCIPKKLQSLFFRRNCQYYYGFRWVTAGRSQEVKEKIRNITTVKENQKSFPGKGNSIQTKIPVPPSRNYYKFRIAAQGQ